MNTPKPHPPISRRTGNPSVRPYRFTTAVLCLALLCGGALLAVSSSEASSLIVVNSTAQSPGASDGNSHPHNGNVNARGAFTCDFGLPPDIPFAQVPAILERDRMFQSARPGFLRKLVPLRIDFTSNELFSGGRYLFDTAKHAADYKEWVENDFTLDGTRFFDRPYFLNPDCQAWDVIAAHDFADLHSSQTVVRTERWGVPHESQLPVLLQDRWPALRDEAERRGLASVWLLYNKHERLVQLVYFADRVVPKDPQVPDFASLAALEFAPPLGHVFDDQSWTKTFDRTHWVLTIWFPFVPGDHGEPSVWPNSPPFPEPYAGDGVCEVSRGEDHENAPSDCGPQCGDRTCQEGENTMSCPGDCRN